jgi:hypothetical protein
MDSDPSGSGQWRFAQAFGDKGEVEDITEGTTTLLFSFFIHTHNSDLVHSGYYINSRI